MQFLIVGCGSIGKRHLQNLRSLGYENFLVCSRSQLRAEELERELGVATCWDLDDGLAGRPDAVLISNPTALHVPVAIRAAKAGCHLFIEKPLGHSLDGVDLLVGEVMRRRLIALIGYNLRFHPGLKVLKETIEAGHIGRTLFAQAHVGQYLPDWRPSQDYRVCYSSQATLGGGVLLDLSHELDYLYWLFGRAKSVTAVMRRLGGLETDVEDYASILVEFHDGPQAEVHLDYLQRVPRRDCQITGEEGVLIWDYHAGIVTLKTPGQPPRELFCAPGYDRNQMYLDEMKHFLACISGSEKPAIPLEQGRDVLVLAVAAKESARRGATVRL